MDVTNHLFARVLFIFLMIEAPVWLLPRPVVRKLPKALNRPIPLCMHIPAYRRQFGTYELTGIQPSLELGKTRGGIGKDSKLQSRDSLSRQFRQDE